MKIIIEYNTLTDTASQLDLLQQFVARIASHTPAKDSGPSLQSENWDDEGQPAD